MEKMVAKLGRPKSAMEPSLYVGATKTCPFCSSTNVEYKFLNNNKIEQPRYKCMGCKKFFTHNPSSRRKTHPQGYLKVASNSVASQDLLNIATVSCLNPSCGKVGTSKFLFYNNGKVTQPRYKCGACNTTFTHGGRLKLKKNAHDTNIPKCGVCAGQLLSLKRKFEDSVQDVEGNGEWLKLRSSYDTTDVGDLRGIEGIEQPTMSKKIHVLNNQFSGRDKDNPNEIAKTLQLWN